MGGNSEGNIALAVLFSISIAQQKNYVLNWMDNIIILQLENSRILKRPVI